MTSKETIAQIGAWYGDRIETISLYENPPWMVMYSVYNKKNRYLDICYNRQIWLGEKLDNPVPKDILNMYHFWKGMLTT